MGVHHAQLEQFQRDAEFYRCHFEELLRAHPNEWVAILDEQVVGADSELTGLLADVERSGRSAAQAYVSYVAPDEVALTVSGT